MTVISAVRASKQPFITTATYLFASIVTRRLDEFAARFLLGCVEQVFNFPWISVELEYSAALQNLASSRSPAFNFRNETNE